MGSSRSTPTSSTVQQVRQEYPAYFQPYLEDVLTGAQQQYQREYEPFPESRLVETPEKRTEALTALQDMDLARMSQGVYNDAIAGTQAAGTGFPDTNLESYMNPYQQLVTDQLLRNATERRGVARKGIGDAAARSGAYGGSRQGVAEAMFDRDTQRELTDLEERSNMAAFQNALAASQADKQRQLASSAQLGQLGQAQQQALTSGIAGVEKAATAEQALAQQARDIALQDFRSQEGFDTQKLAEYSAIIRGATPPANQFIDKTTSTPQSGLQQLGGIASLGAGLFGMGKAKGGPVEYAHGGDVQTFDKGGVPDDVTQDVVTNAIAKLSDIGNGEITIKQPGMEALHAHPSIASTTVDIDVNKGMRGSEQVTDVMDIDSMTGLQGLGQAPAVDGFDMDSAREVTTDDMSETMMGNTGGPVGLAYGGVPGQPYTEDIGMMGGLASVAGPQMRFAGPDGEVPNPRTPFILRHSLEELRKKALEAKGVKEAPSNNKPPVEVTETEDVTISNTDSGIGSLSQNARERAQLMFERDREKRRLRLAGKDPESSKIIEDIDKKLKVNPNVGIVPSRSWETRKQPDFVKRLKGDYPPALTQQEKYQGAETITDPDDYASDLYTAFRQTKPGETETTTEAAATETTGPAGTVDVTEDLTTTEAGTGFGLDTLGGGIITGDPNQSFEDVTRRASGLELVQAKESGNKAKKEVEDLGFKLPLTNAQLVSMGLALMSGREEGLTAAAKVIAGQKSAKELDAIIKKAQQENKAKLAEHLRKARKDQVELYLKSKDNALEVQKFLTSQQGKTIDQSIKMFNALPDMTKMSMIQMAGGNSEANDKLSQEDKAKLAMNNISLIIAENSENLRRLNRRPSGE